MKEPIKVTRISFFLGVAPIFIFTPNNFKIKTSTSIFDQKVILFLDFESNYIDLYLFFTLKRPLIGTAAKLGFVLAVTLVESLTSVYVLRAYWEYWTQSYGLPVAGWNAGDNGQNYKNMKG